MAIREGGGAAMPFMGVERNSTTWYAQNAWHCQNSCREQDRHFL